MEDLKARLYEEKKIIKEILKVLITLFSTFTFTFNLILQETGYEVDVNTTFDQFTAHIASDPRSDSLDRGNIRLTFNSVSTHTPPHTHILTHLHTHTHPEREREF